MSGVLITHAIGGLAPLQACAQFPLRSGARFRAKNFSAVVAAVAAVSKGRKARMRAKVRRIYEECMATDAKLADCFLRDLSLAVRAPRQAAALKAAESLRGPDCPSHDLDVAGDNPRYGWSVG